jgi:hypothetical protein
VALFNVTLEDLAPFLGRPDHLTLEEVTRMIGSEHLTEESVSYIMTKPGQAHFARVDTSNTCRECAHWLSKGERTNAGLLKDARCRKALLMSAGKLPEVPHTAWACKHFEANPTPPAI